MNHPGSGVGSALNTDAVPGDSGDCDGISETPLSLFDSILLLDILDSRRDGSGGDSKIPLTSRAGGYTGVTTSEDGSLYKLALAHEVTFYESLASDPVFAPLTPYIPKFYRVPKYQGKLEDGDIEITHEAQKEEKGRCLRLEKCRKSSPYLRRQYI